MRGQRVRYAGLLRSVCDVGRGVYDGRSGICVCRVQDGVNRFCDVGDNLTDSGREELNHWFEKGVEIHG